MPDWSIKIVPSDSGVGAAFVPDLNEAQQGDPLLAQQFDLVSWNNTTNDTHQIGLPNDPLSGLAVFETEPIPAGRSSSPLYNVAQPNVSPSPPAWTITYYCLLHPSEKGTISATVIAT